MDQQRMYQMQQDQHDQAVNQAVNQAAQVADLTATFLGKRVKATEAGMLTAAHRKKYGGQQGTVFEITEPDASWGIVAGLRILWDDGTESKSLAYMVELAV